MNRRRWGIEVSADEADADGGALMDRVALGDPVAFTHVYRSYSGQVMALALRILRSRSEAEEVVQEVFFELWRRARQFRHERAPLGGWLFLIARSRAVDRQRQVLRRSDDALEEVQAWREPIDFAQLDRGALGWALEQRIAVERAFFDDWTHNEIATRLGAPLGTVKTRIRAGLVRLAELLGDPRPPGSGITAGSTDSPTRSDSRILESSTAP